MKRLVALATAAVLLAAIIFGVKWLGRKNYDSGQACVESGGEAVYVGRVQRRWRDGQWVEVPSFPSSVPPLTKLGRSS